ncbi:uncharacterized protein VTP21DRAFT_4605 [Calcarisporiella thermophila]|uniref:uncharacterized protein n=1 Tax=Calcarisporiella thermophila TaxID=911321 RepID=UPI00374402E0
MPMTAHNTPKDTPTSQLAFIFIDAASPNAFFVSMLSLKSAIAGNANSNYTDPFVDLQPLPLNQWDNMPNSALGKLLELNINAIENHISHNAV